jgi:Uncharacterized protein conserved in bacteria (DUF2252)
MSERALDDLVKYTTIARFEPHGRSSAKATRATAAMAFCRSGYGSTPPLRREARSCRTLTRAGDAVAISAYLGNGTEFDKAIAQFAVAYAGQTERDWGVLCDAI